LEIATSFRETYVQLIWRLNGWILREESFRRLVLDERPLHCGVDLARRPYRRDVHRAQSLTGHRDVADRPVRRHVTVRRLEWEVKLVLLAIEVADATSMWPSCPPLPIRRS
jgi:hypothetical protein